MSAALPVQSGAPARRAVTSARRPLPLLTQRRRILALAVLFGLVCRFFGAVAVSGRRESPLGVFSGVVFLTIRLLGAGVGLWKLRRVGFNPRLPAHWMLLAFSLSLLLGALGTVTWLSYNLRGVLVPYPSPADIGFGAHTLLWAAGLFVFYAMLQTTLREELGPFLGLLTATWSLTVVLISLALGSTWAAAALPKLALSIYYPFVWALNCALAGSLVLGPKFKQMTGSWRAFVAVAYSGALVLFLTNIIFAVSSAVPAESTAAKYLYHNGGTLDFLFATGNYLLMLGIVLLPLGRPLYDSQQDAPMQAGAPAVRTSAGPRLVGRRTPDGPRTRRKQRAAGHITRGAVPISSGRTVQARTMDDRGASKEMWALLKSIRAELQVVRRELERGGDRPPPRQQPRRFRSRTVRAQRDISPGKPDGGQGQPQRPNDFVPLAVHPGANDDTTMSKAQPVDVGPRGHKEAIVVAAVDLVDAQRRWRPTEPFRADSPGDRALPSATPVGPPDDPARRWQRWTRPVSGGGGRHLHPVSHGVSGTALPERRCASPVQRHDDTVQARPREGGCAAVA